MRPRSFYDRGRTQIATIFTQESVGPAKSKSTTLMRYVGIVVITKRDKTFSA